MNISQHSLIETLLGVLSTIVVVIAVTFVIVRVRDKRLMSGRMLGTGLLTLAMIFVIMPAMHKGGRDVIGGVFFTVAWGWCLAIIWLPAISGAVGNLFGGLYDGGGQAVEAKPFYSIFSSKRSQGKYYEALAEIRRQLEKFPEDFQGLIHLAELQAENLDDLPGAAVTIDRLCQQRDRTPSEIAFALNRLADWRLELIKDPDAAREALEKIIQLLPDSEMSQRAAQRIAHLASADSLLAAEQPRTITMRKGPENLGLIREQGKLKVPEPDKDAESQS